MGSCLRTYQKIALHPQLIDVSLRSLNEVQIHDLHKHKYLFLAGQSRKYDPIRAYIKCVVNLSTYLA